MSEKTGWNWESGEKTVQDLSKTSEEVRWLEEWHASPDGEKIACVACTDDAEFSFVVNGEVMENRFEKAICPKFTPDGRLAALVSLDMEWTVAEDGNAWEETYGFLWDMQFGNGSLSVGVQQDMQYGMVVNGTIWDELFENANSFALSPCGKHSAAAVQVQALAQADIFTFQDGVFSLAVDGKVWDMRAMNFWTPVFSNEGGHVACQARKSLYDYTIAVDGKFWSKDFACVWEPSFNPADGSVVAPVRMNGKWGMAKDGEILWQPQFTQLWQQQYSQDGKTLWAICSPKYGKFTVCRDAKPWDCGYLSVTDLSVSPDGNRAAAVGRTPDKGYNVIVDGTAWNGRYDMIWKPIFSDNGSNVAVKVKKGERYNVLVDGKACKEDFDMVFDPVFSPDGTSVLIKGIQGGVYKRIVAPVADFRKEA
ncbi:electron transfer complex subunit TmcD [Salidesulfovibrio brasiliensis]|uniref:electron transfer complex subunit TmcD n=1 Tax=Salidesulfovibrio brasiliensis TaxID=221711 RepID=UPI0006CF8157|nr:hypothetical protein [Salidesulfovibrio brasiliensis]